MNFKEALEKEAEKRYPKVINQMEYVMEIPSHIYRQSCREKFIQGGEFMAEHLSTEGSFIEVDKEEADYIAVGVNDNIAPKSVYLKSIISKEGKGEANDNYFVKATKNHQGYNHNDTAIYLGGGMWDFANNKKYEVVEWLEELPSPQGDEPLPNNLEASRWKKLSLLELANELQNTLFVRPFNLSEIESKASRVVWKIQNHFSPNSDKQEEVVESDAVAFAEWLAKGNWVSASLAHEKFQYWHQVHYEKDHILIVSEEFTTPDLYQLFKQKP